MKQIIISVYVGFVLARGACGADDPQADVMNVMPLAQPHPPGTLLFAIFLPPRGQGRGGDDGYGLGVRIGSPCKMRKRAGSCGI